ncbi:MAG: SH3 domain-containing protein [Candidatus Dojkabacteria bacterium]|nr:SH3 domain-containing protein [Candidatus Dojkabacteria bacterium]
MKYLKFCLILQLILYSLTVQAFTNTVYAQNIITNELELKIDRSITKKTRNYSIPKEIVVVPIQLKSKLISAEDITPLDWFRGIYYYTITRLGYEDIPFHYIVTHEGDIYKGINDIDDRIINFGDYNQNAIIIGYLDNTNKYEVTDQGLYSLKSLLINLCNKHSINPETIIPAMFYIERNRTTNISKIITSISEINSTWVGYVNKIKSEIRNLFAPQEKLYSVSILGIEYPKELFDQANEVELKIKIKNIGSNGIYPDTESSIYLTRDNRRPSMFYLASSWSSFSQISLQNDPKSILLPSEEITVPFKIRVPLYIGEYAENFIITNQQNKNILSNVFPIKLNIRDSGRQIVAIRPVPNGILNIRSGPGINFPIVTVVTEGSRFYFIEQNSLGWVHIDLLDGRTGWTAFWNIEYL